MTKEQLFSILGDIEPQKKPKRPPWVALAACLALVVGIALRFWPQTPAPVPPAGDGPPSITVDGVQYMASSYVAISEECPEGFVYGGPSEWGDYYVNPEVPEWVYVYCEVRSSGQTDQTGTLIPTQPHMAYLRYVDAEIRGDDFVCCDGVLYRSLWSSTCWGDNPDMSPEAYDAVIQSYGPRIEGAAPAGFDRKGRAEFSGYDTVPTGTLSCNTGTPEILLSKDGQILLASTVWHTAPQDDGQTEHQGWNVYVPVQAG